MEVDVHILKCVCASSCGCSESVGGCGLMEWGEEGLHCIVVGFIVWLIAHNGIAGFDG
jgi:hypothetical protein